MTIEKAIEIQGRVVQLCVNDLRLAINNPKMPTPIISARAQDMIQAHDRLQFLLLMKEQQ
jgi:hypothetical protein